MFIFVPFSESIYSIKLSVHLVHKLSAHWIHMHIQYCCCYFNSFTAYLLYMYTLCLPMLAIQTQAHKSLALYSFFASVRAKRRYYLLLFFRCTPFLMPFYYTYMYWLYASWHIHIWNLYGFLLLFHFFFCVAFCFSFLFSFVHLIWFYSIALALCFIEYRTYFFMPANAPIRLNLI